MTTSDEKPDASSSQSGWWSDRGRWYLVGLIGLLGLAASCAVAWALWIRETDVVASRFKNDADDRMTSIQQQLQKDLDKIEATGAFYKASTFVDDKEFSIFTGELIERLGGLEAIAWLPEIRHDERILFEKELSRAADRDIQISTFDERKQRVPLSEFADYYPVLYVEPATQALRMLGLDHKIQIDRWSAMQQARDRGSPFASDPILTPDGAESGQMSTRVLVYLPFYKGYESASQIESLSGRRSYLHGFVVGVLRPEEIVSDLSGQQNVFDVRLIDQTAPEKPILAEHLSPGSKGQMSSDAEVLIGEADGLPKTMNFSFAGRDWSLECMPTVKYLHDQRSGGPLISLLVGIALTGALVLYVLALTGQTARVERIVAQRATDLAHTNDELKREIVVREWAEQALRDSEALYHSLVEHLPMRVFRKDARGRFTFGNPEFCRDLGFTLQELCTKSDFDIAPRELAEKYRADDREILESGQIFHQVEELYNADDGKRFIETIKTTVFDHRGEIVGIQGIYWDVTARHLAEEQVKRTSAELERSNIELEQFAFIASHDLQEPLRAVAGYCELLRRRYHDKLDSDANEFIDFAVGGAHRMRELLNGLLTYSRAGSHGTSFVATDCNQAVEGSLANLKKVVEETGASIEHDSLPTVHGDLSQLTQLFQNLLANAMKYRGEQPLQVHISAEKVDREEWRISVRDNGIGIDEKHADRIFLVFQRLHTQEEIPGTGVGLAICKKIVDRHGGRIWLESELGQGATFHVALPVLELPKDDTVNQNSQQDDQHSVG